MPARRRLVVADDHEGVLEEVFRLLSTEFDVVRTVRHGQELVDATEELKPDGVVSDIHMPGMDGICACRRLLERGYPGALVLLTMHSESVLVDRAFRAGIHAYVLKSDADEDLIPAIIAAIGGHSYRSRNVFSPTPYNASV
jgi:DNA-binding NarL/FixJ family response regulator